MNTQEATKANEKQIGGDHYTKMGVQPWEVVDSGPVEQKIGYYRWTAMAYIMRMGAKDKPIQEIGKAKHLLEKLLEVLGEEETKKQSEETARARLVLASLIPEVPQQEPVNEPTEVNDEDERTREVKADAALRQQVQTDATVEMVTRVYKKIMKDALKTIEAMSMDSGRLPDEVPVIAAIKKAIARPERPVIQAQGAAQTQQPWSNLSDFEKAAITTFEEKAALIEGARQIQDQHKDVEYVMSKDGLINFAKVVRRAERGEIKDFIEQRFDI